MYEKDGEKYFVLDSHLHFWDASPDNWVKGHEQYAKGWIECFHAYQGLGPPATHWTLEHFQKYSVEDFEKDVFRDGHVDIGDLPVDVPEGVVHDRVQRHRAERLAARPLPGQADPQRPLGPARGRGGAAPARGRPRQVRHPGREALHGRVARRLARLEADRPGGACRSWTSAQALGIKNIHVHKGPTIWPLDKDAFDVSDIDHVATDFPELNFIVEHVGLPRIEDFCFMATQEPNVYAGLAVVIGGLMHARPRFFAKVMGELLFWVGEDKMLFGSDYAIWEPKWQVEGFVDWEMPDDEAYADYPRLDTAGKKKIMGLNAAKLYGVDVPEDLRLPADAGTPAEPADAQLVEGRA